MATFLIEIGEPLRGEVFDLQLRRLERSHFIEAPSSAYAVQDCTRLSIAPQDSLGTRGKNSRYWNWDLLQGPVTVDAIDVSMAQCPPTSWLPENIRLVTHDVYRPFPSHMQGTYDLVHVQNWLCIWKTENSQDLIRNLLDLLSAYTSDGYYCVTSFAAWVSGLGDHLGRQAKLVTFDRYKALNEHQLLWSIGVLQACEEFASNLERNARHKEDVESAAGLRSAAESASAEMLNGVGIYSELVVAVAQKDTS
ncbi:MAG: hypothetical protein Q9211_000262 [Gyalolechia sp. 1 TL-2023]